MPCQALDERLHKLRRVHVDVTEHRANVRPTWARTQSPRQRSTDGIGTFVPTVKLCPSTKIDADSLPVVAQLESRLRRARDHFVHEFDGGTTLPPKCEVTFCTFARPRKVSPPHHLGRCETQNCHVSGLPDRALPVTTLFQPYNHIYTLHRKTMSHSCDCNITADTWMVCVFANDKVIIIADTRHTQRWSERKVDPMLCKGNLAFFCNCPVTLETLRLWAHECTPGIPRKADELETTEFADVLGTIAEDAHLTRCDQVLWRRK